MQKMKLLVIPFVFGLVLASVRGNALADEYDESQSNPLRIVAYVTHPVGVLLEWTIFRPFHALVSATKETEYIFGHRPHPPLFPVIDGGLSQRSFQRPEAAKAAPAEVIAERVVMQVKEVPIEKTVTVIKEVPQVVEVERVLFPDIAFEFNSVELTPLGKGRAYLAAQRLKEKAELLLVVEGHSDTKGSPEYNYRLGLRRAERVIKELTELGVDPARVSAASVGESKPLIDQDTDWARAVNRRVEFTVKAQ